MSKAQELLDLIHADEWEEYEIHEDNITEDTWLIVEDDSVFDPEVDLEEKVVTRVRGGKVVRIKSRRKKRYSTLSPKQKRALKSPSRRRKIKLALKKSGAKRKRKKSMRKRSQRKLGKTKLAKGQVAR